MAYVLTVVRLDADGFAEAEVVDYDSLEWTESVAASGWSMSGSEELARQMQNSGGIAITDTETGRTWSGHVVDPARQSGDVGRIVGNSDLCLLAQVIPHPSPIDLNVATQSHDVITGTAGAAIADLIDRNAGPTAHASRERGWTITETNVAGTPATTIRARWTPNLLEWVQRKAVPNGVTVEIVADTDAGGHAVTVRGATTVDVVFAEELLSMLEWAWSERPPTATHVYAAGTGTGTARVVRFSSAADGFIREQFLDRRNITDTAELDQEIVEALEAGRRKISLTAQLTDRTGARYGTDFLLGDLVRLWVGDVEIVEPVTEVRCKATPAGVDRYLTVGFGPVDPSQRGRVEARRTAARLDDIEGAQ